MSLGKVLSPADNEAKIKPPMQGAFTETSLTAATATGAIATGVATTGPGYYSFACTSAFMIVFDTDSTITNPTNSSVLPAGVYRFYLDSTITHFKVTAASNGTLTHWKSSHGTT